MTTKGEKSEFKGQSQDKRVGRGAVLNVFGKRVGRCWSFAQVKFKRSKQSIENEFLKT